MAILRHVQPKPHLWPVKSALHGGCNLQSIPSLKGSDIATEEGKKSASDLLQRYLKKLSEVETKLEAKRIEHTKMLERENKARQDLEKTIEWLLVE